MIICTQLLKAFFMNSNPIRFMTLLHILHTNINIIFEKDIFSLKNKLYTYCMILYV
jgi:hypothetical protein